MNYKDLKNGDVIVFTHYGDRIAIFNDIKKDDISGQLKFNTYVEFVDMNDIFFEKDEPGYSDILEDMQFRLATEEEKYALYNAIGKYFTENYDKDWYNHFTDSSYFDIVDYLLDIFCIKMSEHGEYPDFIDEIKNYIWSKCCNAVGMPDGFNEEPEEQMVSLEKVKAWLKENMYESDSDEKWVNTYFHTMEEMLNNLETSMK